MNGMTSNRRVNTMKNYKNYFEKNGFIYGVSSKYQFGWKYSVYKFTDIETAEEWLHTETYDFAERELMSKTAAVKLTGTEAVENADER
jgi:hypothetical protein